MLKNFSKSVQGFSSMRAPVIIKVFGILLMIFSISMIPPMAVALYYGGRDLLSFVAGFGITCLAGLALWFPAKHAHYELKTRDGFLIVFLFWTVLSAFATIPFLIVLYPHIDIATAMFETVSGLTTTGASVLRQITGLSHAILYYRQQLHFLGGMGIIVLAVAILPMLGVGGMQLYRAETVGPVKTAKLKPRITQSAKALWYIYVGLVVLCALAYWVAGMSLYDAIGESFSTISTGGFSIHSNSFAYYHSDVIDLIAVFFMIMGATNFALHFRFIRNRHLSTYYHDAEFAGYIKLLAVVSIITAITLIIYHHSFHGHPMINALFTVVSLSTTTGFTTTDFNLWPTFLPYLLMFVALLGGSSGSTSGGIKIIRCLLLKEQGKREIDRLVHPRAVVAVGLGGETMSESIVQAIWAFLAVFIALFIVLLLLLLADGLPIRTAFGALAACLSNTGAGIGGVSHGFNTIPSFSKWVLIVAMLAGRLEIFTILVLFTPSYWRK